MYIYTRVDPCIKCTRSKLDTGQGVLGLVAPEDLLSVCCLVLPLVLSSVVGSWASSRLLPASLGPSWRLLGPSLGRLGRLFAAESEFSRNLLKTMVFAWFLHGCEPSGGLLAPSWRLLSWAVLSGPGWFLGGPGLVPGGARRRRTCEGSEAPYVFIV